MLPLTVSHVHLADGVRLAPRRTQRHVLARGLCRFRRIDFGDLGRSERLGFLGVQIASWQPFARTDYALALDDKGAMVFAWDGQAFAERCAVGGLETKNFRILPETMLHPRAKDEGARLVACISGWEGQVWLSGRLETSRWWSEAPDESAWENFVRGAGLTPTPVLAKPADAALPERLQRASPWLALRTPDRLRQAQGLALHLTAAVILAALCIAAFHEVRAHWLLEERITALTAEKTRLEEKAAPQLAAREEALASQARLETLVHLVDRPPAIELLAHLAEAISAQDTIVRELEWSDGRLRLALQIPPGASRVSYVRALEKGGWFVEVREAPLEPGMIEGVNLVLQAGVPWPRASKGGNS